MKRLHLTTNARSDLDEIYLNVREWSGGDRDAEIVTDRILSQCEKLASLSGTLGRPRRELSPDLRSFPFRGYIIFFRYSEDELQVINVLSQRLDLDGYFESDD